jgi:hypothetical protein
MLADAFVVRFGQRAWLEHVLGSGRFHDRRRQPRRRHQVDDHAAILANDDKLRPPPTFIRILHPDPEVPLAPFRSQHEERLPFANAVPWQGIDRDPRLLGQEIAAPGAVALLQRHLELGEDRRGGLQVWIAAAACQCGNEEQGQRGRGAHVQKIGMSRSGTGAQGPGNVRGMRPRRGIIRTMLRRLLLLGCLVTQVGFATNAVAQAEAARKSTFGRVVGMTGAPLAGATVTFAGGLPHLGAEQSPRDVQVVASDTRGRVQAKLKPGLCYVVWAVGPADAAGGSMMAPPIGFFGAGAMVELRCDTVGRVRRVPCRGLEPWSALGPLRHVAVTPFPGDEVELTVDAEGAVLVPPGPFQQLEVRTRDGQPLWSTTAGCEALIVPPPQRVAVKVVDEKGAPMAGVVLRHRVARATPWRIDGFGGVSDGRFRDLGTTPASGELEVVVPYATHPLAVQSAEDLLLFACPPHRPATVGGVFGKNVYQDDRRMAAFSGTQLVFTCPQVAPMCGNVGVVPAGTIAHLAAVCKLVGDRASYTHDPRSFTTTIAEDGTFQLDEVPAELHSCRLTLIPPPGSSRVLPLFPAQSGRELPGEVAVLGQPAAQHTARYEVAGVQLRVVDADGMPAQGVVAFLAPGDLRGVLLRDSLVRVPLDSAGGGRLAMLPGTWVLLVVSRKGYCATKLELQPGEVEETLSLLPLARMQVTLADREGKPVAGAQLQSRRSSTRASGDPVQSLLQSYATYQRNQWQDLRTDAEGSLVVWFVPVEGITNRVGFTWEGGMTDDFAVEVTAEPLRVRPR